MIGTKKWYESKSIWGSIVAVLSLIIGAFGYSASPEDQELLVLAISGLVGAAGELFAIYGRVKASREIEP